MAEELWTLVEHLSSIRLSLRSKPLQNIDCGCTRMLLLQRARRVDGRALPFEEATGRFAPNRCRISIVAATRMLLLQRARARGRPSPSFRGTWSLRFKPLQNIDCGCNADAPVVAGSARGRPRPYGSWKLSRFASNCCRISIVAATRMRLVRAGSSSILFASRKCLKFRSCHIPRAPDAAGSSSILALRANRCRISLLAATRMLLLQRARRVDGLALTDDGSCSDAQVVPNRATSA